METFIQRNFNAYLKTTGELSTWIAIASFAIGTAFFVSYKSGIESEEIFFFGFLFVCLAALVNLLVLANLLILLLTERDHREYFAIKILIVLANIPVTAFYFKLL
ncbi:hypothetical protein HUK80_01565 [Flavobacterium sp. MAH-1]|uniref:Uncharacterized protein n=1 Tax=Flavobacterium agri TaxID=2743471 RepID=A0A7Y8XZI2_9FLAO|nr:hypothetical protein [Flavobacterium agri]NUY79566.1 hypothetical protein [Flavobacterium agri]NYA69591.1 hypothetical protein [Flavobacterium agri]